MVVRRPRRDFDELARRRRLAARLFARGESILASVARQGKASRQSGCPTLAPPCVGPALTHGATARGAALWRGEKWFWPWGAGQRKPSRKGLSPPGPPLCGGPRLTHGTSAWRTW